MEHTINDLPSRIKTFSQSTILHIEKQEFRQGKPLWTALIETQYNVLRLIKYDEEIEELKTIYTTATELDILARIAKESQEKNHGNN